MQCVLMEVVEEDDADADDDDDARRKVFISSPGIQLVSLFL